MKRKINQLFSGFIILALITTLFPSVPGVKAAESIKIYVNIVDENGNPYKNSQYEPGFMGDVGSMPTHEHLNQYGAALICQSISSNNVYQYFSYGKIGDYEDYSDTFTITQPYTILTIQLAKKDSVKKTTGKLLLPGDSGYPADPFNPKGAPEKKVDIHGYVKDSNGGVENARVKIINPTKNGLEEDYSMTVTTDSNGYYALSGVDEKRFGTYQILAQKDKVSYLTAITKKDSYYYSGFSTLDANKSYDFGEVNTQSNPGDIENPSAIAITPALVQLKRGSVYQFHAEITSDTPIAEGVVWSVAGAADSVISQEGQLTVGAAEKDKSFQVIAAAKADAKLSAAASVIVSGTLTPPGQVPGESPDLDEGGGSGEDLDEESDSEEDDNEERVAHVKLNAAATAIQVGKSSNGLAIEKKYPSKDKVAKWTSSNKKIVKVDAKTGKIKGIGKGSAKVTVKMKSGATAVCKVKVQAKRVRSKKVSLNEKKVSLRPGKKVTLLAKKNPVTAEGTLKWTTSNKKIVRVDAKGKVTAKKKGTATITVRTSNGKKATCKITVH